jgi:hypothetical protein
MGKKTGMHFIQHIEPSAVKVQPLVLAVVGVLPSFRVGAVPRVHQAIYQSIKTFNLVYFKIDFL